MREITGGMAVCMVIMALLFGWGIGQCIDDNKKSSEKLYKTLSFKIKTNNLERMDTRQLRERLIELKPEYYKTNTDISND